MPPSSKCPDGVGVNTSVCIYEPPHEVPTCVAAEFDPEWEMTEKVPPSGPRVVILGAGLAGLTAAQSLLKAGYTNFVVLEADCRAGGRLRSRWAGDTVVELGHRLRKKRQLTWDHPLVRAGLSEGLFDPPSSSDPASGILDPGLSLPVTLRAYSALTSMIEEEEECKMNIPGIRGLRIEQAGRTLPAFEKMEAAKVMAAISSLMGPKLQVVEDSFGAYALAPSGTRVPLGESGVLVPLLETLGKNRVIYRKEAVAIRWGTVTLDQLPRAIVRCRDGSEYPAEFVIITFSLGCLKQNMDTMFFPPLPAKKTTAIQKIEFVKENKAFLVFQQPIWSWAPKPIEIIITPKTQTKSNSKAKSKSVNVEMKKEKKATEEKSKSNTEPRQKDKNKLEIKTNPQQEQKKKTDEKLKCGEKSVESRCWSDGIIEIKQVEGSEMVIGVRVVGDDAVHMERDSDEIVLAVLHSVLQEKLGIGKIPIPKTVIRSKWCDSRKFFGLHAKLSEPSLRSDLAAPLPVPDQLPPILLFAGEATANSSCSYQGAVLSGIREAERLVSLIKKFPTPSKDICPVVCK